MLWLLLGILLPIIIYYFVLKPHTYWNSLGIAQDKPFPLIGSNVDVFTRKTPFPLITLRIYRLFPNLRYYGSYQFLDPILYITDAELIKQMAIKDFEHFTDHQQLVPNNYDEIWSKNLFSSQGEQWKQLRSLLSPNFTSSKMKMMYTLMEQCTNVYINKILNDPNGKNDVDANVLFAQFANDVIATTAFGIEIDSYTNKDNEFYLMGKKLTNFDSLSALFKFTLFFIAPKLSKLLGLEFLDKKASKFFTEIVCSNIKTREEKGIIRQDLIHLLMQARKGDEHEDESVESSVGFATIEESHIGKQDKKNKRMNLTDIEICAQAILFFFAGFDTVSSTMSFIAYELAINQDVQQKLRDEINDVLRENNGKVTYESLMKMKYMDMVITEAMRLWPNVIMLDRMCTQDYTIQPKNKDEKPLFIKKGTLVNFPTYGLHRDEKYYENPDKFDPERFSDENKSKINPYAYIPFGIGPRACIGSRFALMEMKLLFFHMLSKMEVHPSPKTPIPMKLQKVFSLKADPGIFLDFKPLN